MKTNKGSSKDTSIALGQCSALLIAVVAIIRTLRPEAARYAGALLLQGHEALISSALATPSATDSLISAQADTVQMLLAAFQEQAELT